jgi:hypothetical protein
MGSGFLNTPPANLKAAAWRVWSLIATSSPSNVLVTQEGVPTSCWISASRRFWDPAGEAETNLGPAMRLRENSPHKLSRAITETEPQRPSTVADAQNQISFLATNSAVAFSATASR